MTDIVKRLSEKLAGLPEGFYRECGPVMSDARAEIERLRAALGDMFALIDEGWLVRDTSEDHKPSFAMRQLTFVRRLQEAQKPLNIQQPSETT